MRAALTLAALAVALLLAPLPALAELPRHTPNFPHGIVIEDRALADLLSKLASLDRNYERYLEELVEMGAVSPSDALKLVRYDPEKISDLDPELQRGVARILEGESLSPEELEELVKRLLELEHLGAVDPHTLVALVRVIAEGFRRLNLEVPAQLSASALRNLLDILRPGFTARSAADSVKVVELGGSLGEFLKMPKLVAFSPPVPQVGEPSSLLHAALLATATAAVFLLLTRGRVLGTVLAKLPIARTYGARVGGSADDAISIYWKSVELVERRLGTRRADHQTHREFLSLVEDVARSRGGLERAARCFREITEVYEVSRFSYVESADEVSRRARERFADLVRSLG